MYIIIYVYIYYPGSYGGAEVRALDRREHDGRVYVRRGVGAAHRSARGITREAGRAGRRLELSARELHHGGGEHGANFQPQRACKKGVGGADEGGVADHWFHITNIMLLCF